MYVSLIKNIKMNDYYIHVFCMFASVSVMLNEVAVKKLLETTHFKTATYMLVWA